MIEIDYLNYQDKLNLKNVDGKRMVFDPIRKKFIVLGPEELVRQMVIQYLIEDRSYNKNKIAVEKSLQVNKQLRRFDILIYKKEISEPFLLVECKAPKVKISQKTFEQIAWYNMPLKVDYLMVTNGMETFCCKMDYENESFDFLKEIPSNNS